jgi:hypothetical protein
MNELELNSQINSNFFIDELSDEVLDREICAVAFACIKSGN